MAAGTIPKNLLTRSLTALGALLVSTSLSAQPAPAPAAQAPARPPNILVIMGDDIGIWNIGAYHRGLMAARTPNLDKLAAEGMLFTDYYAEASCTAGRANFITGMLPIRTGLTTVGQAGATVGMPGRGADHRDGAPRAGLRDRPVRQEPPGRSQPSILPCLHGFDEYSGYLYHLDAMEDPFWHSYPAALKDTVGPRNVVQLHRDRHRGRDRAAALGQGRQAAHRR